MFGNVARSRLLPMSLPFRYFGAAAGFQLGAWGLLFFFSNELVQFEIGLGPIFAALHLLTLGVLAMSAIGATLQLLPVATRQPVRALWAVRLQWWLFGAGAMAVVLSVLVYGILLFRNLLGARGMRVVVAHGWAALACLVALAATGLLLVGRYEHGWAIDHQALRSAHLVLAAFGFMGLLAIGLSGFLLPMLAVAPPPPQRVAYAVLGLAVAGIVMGSLGLALPGALAGLAAALVHVASMERSLHARLRPRLEPSFLLVRVSWACLIGCLVLAALMALDLAPARAPLVFALLLVPGWLLTFLLGVLQRIVPFLASVHASASDRGTPIIAALTPLRLLAAHRLLHVAALALLLAAALTGQTALAAAGAACGFAAATLFSGFFVFVLCKVRHGIQPPHQPAAA
jgi:hypothetical protein